MHRAVLSTYCLARRKLHKVVLYLHYVLKLSYGKRLLLQYRLTKLPYTYNKVISKMHRPKNYIMPNNTKHIHLKRLAGKL